MFLDCRLGNEQQWRFTKPKDWNMRFPETMRKSVVYCARVIEKGSKKEVVFCGTGFLVSVKSARVQGNRYGFVVTARHVADRMLLGDWVIRINTSDGRSIDVQGTKDNPWWFHPTDPDGVDVAVTTYGVPDDLSVSIDATSTPIAAFLDERIITESNIGAGDEVHIVGIFNKMTGHSRNLPIVRSGNVALIPDVGARIPGVVIRNRPVEAEAYLIEARSVGGISGSPVFVRTTGTLIMPSQNKATGEIQTLEWSVPGKYYLMGLVHGHWEVLAQDKNETEPRTAVRGREDAVNMGIAVVIPANKIKEVLYHPEIVAMMAKSDQDIIDAQGTTTSDSAGVVSSATDE
jgi:hypothetical protein